jgi:hypothetical protein
MARPVTFLAIGATLLLAACPPPKTGGTGPGTGSGSGSNAATQDDQLEFPAVTLNGSYFAPEGMDRLDFLLAHGKKKTTLDKQRAAVKKAKPETRAGEAAILATMLYEASNKEADDTKRATLLEEARKTLADTAAAAPDQADVLLYHDLACLSIDVGDTDGAIAALDAAVKKAPTDAATADRKAYLAYYLVRAGKNDDAAAAVAGMTPSADHPEQAYAIAWAAWRTGDKATARAGMAAAVKGWKRMAFLPAIKRDVLIFAARADASVDEALDMAKSYSALVSQEANGQNQELLAMLVYMNQAYSFVGRTADSSALIDKIFSEIKSLTKTDVPKLHLQQADAARILGDTEGLVAHVGQAVDALKNCGADCQGQVDADAAKLVFNLARLSALFYNTAQDERWFTAMDALYADYLQIPGITDATAVQTELKGLDQGHAHAKKGAGVHDKDAVNYVLQPHAPEVLGCYDDQLQKDPTLSGNLKLTLEVADTGKVSGKNADPGAGEQGLAAVAACALDHAAEWAFPSRTKPGTTRVTVSYVLQPSQK